MNKFYTDFEVSVPAKQKPLCNINIQNFQQAANADGYRDENGKWGYLDQNGRVAIEPVYDQAGTFGSGPLAPVQKDGLCGAIRADGTTAVQLKYQNIGTFTSCN